MKGNQDPRLTIGDGFRLGVGLWLAGLAIMTVPILLFLLFGLAVSGAGS